MRRNRISPHGAHPFRCSTLPEQLITVIEEAQVFTELAGEVIIASSGQHLGESALSLRPDIAVLLDWFKAVAKGIAPQVVDGGLQAKTLVSISRFRHRRRLAEQITECALG